ncbi:MAG: phosphoenolpyruvate-utilizing protein, partial [Actinomycetota bacterium]|nr:phosphoenolpyruvate-utilizing protein [Actinomycetota bacterium]
MVESAEPARRLWRLGRVVAGDAALTELFDAGLDDLPARLFEEPAAAVFLALLADFRAEFGSRGPNEWEGSSPTWGTDIGLVLAAVGAMRRAEADHDPDHQHAALEADRAAATAKARAGLKPLTRRQFDAAVRSAALLSQGRERSKTTVIRALHTYRLAVLELAGRATDDPTDAFMVTVDELDAFLDDPASFAETIAERRAQRDRLALLDPPFVFIGTQPDPETWTSRAGLPSDRAAVGTVLHGIAGCPGVARGRARV